MQVSVVARAARLLETLTAAHTDHRRLWFVKFNVFVVIGHTAENVEPACGTLAQQAAENRTTTWRQREQLPRQELDYYRAL